MVPIVLKSIILGFLITLPVGPIGIECFRKILQRGPLLGFVLGLSQALALFVFGLIAFFGLGLISNFVTEYELWLQLFGGFVLILFGIKVFFSEKSEKSNKTVSEKKLIADFFSIVFLMLINPPVFLGFLAIFTGLKLYKVTTHFEQFIGILGILLGSVISWALVCLCFVKYKKRVSQKVMHWINQSAGIFLAGFGLAICISAILSLD